MSALPQGHASLFQNTMDSLPPLNQAVLRRTLARLADDRFVAIINHLTAALPGHLRHYVYILGALNSTKAEPSKTIAGGTVQQQKANDASVLSGEELRAGFQKLPKEIRDAIETAFIESTLTPGFIFPDQAPGLNGKHFFSGDYFEPTKYEVLLGLNRANYLFHGFHFWSNYFVIGKGPACDSMRWLGRMHDDARAKIRNVYISLSRDDEPERSETRAEYMSWAYHHHVYDPLGLMLNFDREAVHFNALLKWRWLEKVWSLRHLKLENLIIDVRDAFGLDDSFLGDVFMRLVPHFYQKPQSVKVIANNDAWAAALLSMFWARNNW